jgi:hypothetical protein
MDYINGGNLVFILFLYRVGCYAHPINVFPHLGNVNIGGVQSI